MPIEFSTSLDLDLVYSRWFGVVDMAQFRDAFAAYLTDAHYRLGRDELVDFTELEGFEADFKKIWAGLHMVNAQYPGQQVRTRTVLLAPGDVIYGQSRMFQTLAENAQGVRVEVYRDQADALNALSLPFQTIRAMRKGGRFVGHAPRSGPDA
jgi:hypothetical protein